MLDRSYKPSDAPVQVASGPVIGLVTAEEAWAAGVNANNSFTARCGDTWVLLAQERPGAVSGASEAWQMVYDHFETWGEALAIWRALRNTGRIGVIRCLPSPKLKGLARPLLAAAQRAMAREGWVLEAGDEWILKRVWEGTDGQ
ncbi:hypothetical protein [Ruegeria sp.]|uniref:hypothetical protein n=1 Tax=Ruegeria sp. TaxID=1879320 RepID=UPI003C7BB813